MHKHAMIVLTSTATGENLCKYFHKHWSGFCGDVLRLESTSGYFMHWATAMSSMIVEKHGAKRLQHKVHKVLLD